MFIEKLKKQEILDFLATNDGKRFSKEVKEIAKLYTSEKGNIIVEIDAKFCVDRNVEFKCAISDFNYNHNHKAPLYYAEHCEEWLKFMYQKFGEEYKSEFLKQRETEKKNMPKDYSSSRFDAFTVIYLNSFDELNVN